MTPIDLGSYKSIYLKTAKDYVDNMLESIKRLTGNPKDQDAVNNLHIASHSLKSQSQVMGFTDIASICLDIEKISDEALKTGNQIDNIDVLKKSMDKLGLLLSQIRKGDAEINSA